MTNWLYQGRRLNPGEGTVSDVVVSVTDPTGIRKGHALDARLDLRNHSPTGFAWGYGGSGPSQLALALLAHALRNDTQALAHYQKFKATYVCAWGDAWRIHADDIRDWVRVQERAQPPTKCADCGTTT